MSNQVDARYLECPKPVVLTKRALDEIKEGMVTVLVNNAASVANVKRFAESQGAVVTLREHGDYTEVEILKGFGCDLPDTHDIQAEPTVAGSRAIIYVSSDQVGPDGELGRHLLKVFIRNMLEMSRKDLPGKIVFVNRGVKVPCHWKDTIDDLRALEDLGVDILSCGVCLKHYDIEEQLEVGEVGNAFDTVQGFLGSDRLVNIC